MCPAGTLRSRTASVTANAGTISPGSYISIRKAPELARSTDSANQRGVSPPPGRLLGEDSGIRHLARTAISDATRLID